MVTASHQKYRLQWLEDQGGNRNQGTKHLSKREKLRNQGVELIISNIEQRKNIKICEGKGPSNI